MIDQLLGPAVFVAYVAVVGIALVLAVLVFGTGGGRHRPRRVRAKESRRFRQSREWWRRWR